MKQVLAGRIRIQPGRIVYIHAVLCFMDVGERIVDKYARLALLPGSCSCAVGVAEFLITVIRVLHVIVIRGQ